MVDSVSVRFETVRVNKMLLNIRIQWNAGTACVSECVLKTLACRGLRVGPSKVAELQGSTPAPLHRCTVARLHGCTVAGVQGCKAALAALVAGQPGRQGRKVAMLQGCKQGCTVARWQGCRFAKLQGCQVARLQGKVVGLQACKVAKLHGCIVAPLWCTVAQLQGCTVAGLQGCKAARLQSRQGGQGGEGSKAASLQCCKVAWLPGCKVAGLQGCREEKQHKHKFFGRISRGHSWPLRPDALGSKSFSPSPGPQINALFGADVHDFRCGRPWPEGFSKNFVQKQFALIFWPLKVARLQSCKVVRLQGWQGCKFAKLPQLEFQEKHLVACPAESGISSRNCQSYWGLA